MSRKPLPKRGCFHAEYPGTEWMEVPCVSAPPPNRSLRGLRSLTVGAGNDFVAQSSSGRIIQTAVGSFPSVFGVTSEINAPYGPDAFSLQLNSNSNIPTALCPNQGCAGWQQFVFDNFPGGQYFSGVFIQYWLIGADSCPPSWTFFAGGQGEAAGCVLNSPATPYSPVTIADLGNLTLIGEAGVQGMDVVVLYTEPGGGSGAQIDASGQASVLGLEAYWETAEFNVFGAGNGTQAVFNPDSTIVVQVSIDDGTTNAPTCISEGFTAESNSLTLMPELPGPTCLPFYGENAGGSPLPSIEFMESNYGPQAISITALSPSVTGSSAVLSGTINPNGTEALAWFEYNTNSTPSCNLPQNATPPPTPAFNAGSGTYYLPFSANIGGLSPGTTYYFWACALGANYQANSNVESFVTPPLPRPYVFGSGPGPDVIWEEPKIGWAQVWYLNCVPNSSCYQPVGAASLTRANPWNIVGIGDFNGDGKPDVVWQDPVSGAVQIWYLGGPQGVTLIGAANITAENPWKVVSVADFNQDGHPDLLWEDPTSGFAQIWYLGGSQGLTLLGAANLDQTNPWHIVGTGDFNNDGFPDVLWQDPVSGTVQIWYMGGNTPGLQGSVLQYAINLTAATTKVVAIADFNNDGYQDVIFQNPITGAATVNYYTGANGTTPNGTSALGTGNPWYIAGPH